MIPILMTVFALGGTTFGMAEESLAFYVLIITVMIAAGYDTLTGALVILLGCGIGVLGSTVNPFATGIASGFADIPLTDGLALRLVILIVGLAVGIWFVLRYAERVRRDPSTSLVYDMKAANEQHFAATTDADTGEVVLTGQHKLVLGAVRRRLRGDDLWSHPVGGPGHRPADAVVVVPGDDGVVPAVRHPHRRGRQDEGGRAHHDVRRRRPRPGRCRPDHRPRPRHHRDHEQRPDHRHRAVLGRDRRSATSAKPPSPW